MPKRTKKTRRKGTGPSKPSRSASLPPVPDRRALEGLMAGLFGEMRGTRGTRSARDEAQQLMYQAWDSNGPTRVELARHALEIDSDCTDAYVLLAEETAESIEEARDLYAKGVAAGERALGPGVFEEDAGHFWGLLETRPYMRARAGLAASLWAMGDREAGVAHYRDMLRLNPNDNQGIRDLLATCLLDLGRDDDLERLLEQYEDDASALWAYTWALHAFRRGGDSEAARTRLRDAIRTNRHVPAYLLGRKPLPRALPEYVGFGDEDEAVAYTSQNLRNWRQTPGALLWLASEPAGAAPRKRRKAGGRR